LIVTLKRWRPLAWPKIAWRRLSAPQTVVAEPKEKSDGAMQQFEKMASHYADTIMRAATK
jgi:hypothetical protein